MRILIYGNNLNQGYILASNLRRNGIEAKVVMPAYRSGQEFPEWWSKAPIDESLLFRADITDADVWASGRLVDNPEIASIYNEAETYDLLFLVEDGPALFSELTSVPKVFRAAGADIQLIPFSVSRQCGPLDFLKYMWTYMDPPPGNEETKWTRFKGGLHLYKEKFDVFYRYQSRQRRGLRQCAKIMIYPYQRPITRRLRLPQDRVCSVPFPMDQEIASEYDEERISALEKKYGHLDMLLFHPVRQFYLRSNRSRYQKGNDTLIKGYAKYLRQGASSSKLILVRKGPQADITASERLISELGISDRIEWVPEMTNIEIREFLALDNVIVCDQFGKTPISIGNLGREAGMQGCLLISRINKLELETYGDQFPVNVLPADNANEICRALLKVARLSASERDNLREAGKREFEAAHLFPNVLKTYNELFESAVAEGARK